MNTNAVVDVSVIIVTYYSNSIIEECIQSIIQYNDLPAGKVEIIVVDNSSYETFLELDRIISVAFPNLIRLFHNNENYGYGKGNNVGIKHAVGNVICVLNPDVRLTEPLFGSTIINFKSDESLCILGYKQIGGANLSYYLRPEFVMPIIDSFVVKFANHFRFFNPHYFFLSGAFLFLDKSKFSKMGLFDENIFLYNEEADITNRCLREHYTIKFCDDKSYKHLVGDRSAFSHEKFNNELASSLYYLRKYNFSIKWFLFKQLLDSLLKFILSAVLFNAVKKEKFRVQFYLLKDIFLQT